VRTLVVVAAIPVALVGWQWWDDRSTEHTLGPVVSAIAGRAVSVECQSVWASLVDALPRHGEVRFSADGTPEHRVFLTHRTCDRLQAFAGARDHSQLACLGGLEWSAERSLDPRSRCYEQAAPTVYALLTLAHEAYHTAGVTTEATANCYAIQAMAYTAASLGAGSSEAELVALAMNALEPLQGGGYGTRRCVAGSELDLHPETPDFPTEHPLAPPGAPDSRSAV
jgi:hypothetical protein